MYIEKYEITKVLGKGMYGIVYKAKKDNQLFAIKQCYAVPDDQGFPVAMVRELGALRELGQMHSHPHIVELIDVLFDHKQNICNMVLGYMETDLRKMITHFCISDLDVCRYMYQLCLGLKYCHAFGFAHHDIKPDNLLVSFSDVHVPHLRITDFSLVCQVNPFLDQPVLNSNVCTRWYRPPELLMGRTKYDAFAVDMWSCGCVLLELLLGDVAFPGASEQEQIQLIETVLGPFTDFTHTNTNATETNNKQNCFTRHFPPIVSKATPLLINLLETLLCYDVSKRRTAAQACLHPYFDAVRHEYSSN